MAASSGGTSVSAVNRIGPAELKGFGTIAGQRRSDNPRLIDVSLIIEKPPIDIARESFASTDFPTTHSSAGSACTC